MVFIVISIVSLVIRMNRLMPIEYA